MNQTGIQYYNNCKNTGNITRPRQKIRCFLHGTTRKTRYVMSIELADSQQYDKKRYVELLDEHCNSILEPFDSVN